MHPISVVIIAKNEAENIEACIASAQLISDDIVVADSGSNDDTAQLAVQAGAKLLQIDWKGYGQARNEAAAAAIHNWIFALDADERITAGLATAIDHLSFVNEQVLYGFKRNSFLGAKKIRYGEWGRDKVYRLYNRQKACWDLTPVHESITGNTISKVFAGGELLHYTMKDLDEYREKTFLYAKLSAAKFAGQGRKASLVKQYASPVFSFIQNYFFRLGFLDGKEGLIIAGTSARYIFLKYKLLRSLPDKNSSFLNITE